MRITRDIEKAVLPKARAWSLPELVTLILFLLWCFMLLFGILILLYGISVAIAVAWRQWLDVLLWAAISFVSLVFLGWIFYQICRGTEFFCRPKLKEHNP